MLWQSALAKGLVFHFRIMCSKTPVAIAPLPPCILFPSQHSDSHPDNEFDMSSFDGLSHNHDGTQAATTGESPDGDSQEHGGMDFEVSSSHLKGGILAGGMEMVPPVAGGEPGPRVGVDHQAVIPDLSSMVGDGEVFFSFQKVFARMMGAWYWFNRLFFKSSVTSFPICM